jgi:hypothetical protein
MSFGRGSLRKLLKGQPLLGGVRKDASEAGGLFGKKRGRKGFMGGMKFLPGSLAKKGFGRSSRGSSFKLLDD